MTERTPEDRRHDAIGVGVMLLLMLPFALSSIVLPWGRDQGIYAEAAWQILDGRMPYRDVFIFKPPGTPLFHVLSQLLFGPEMVAVRAMDSLWTLAIGLTLYSIARKATGSVWVAVLAGVFFAWRNANIGYWSQAQTDGFANLPYGVALVLILADPGPRWRVACAVGAGLAVGAAFWFKYTTGGLLPFVVLVPLLRWGWRGWPTALAVVGGFAASVAAVLGLLWLGGALDEFITIQRDVVLPYTGAAGDGGGIARRSLSRYWSGLNQFRPETLVPWGFGGVAVLVMAALHTPRLWREGVDDATLARLAALAWGLSGLLSAFAQGKFWKYQFLTTLGGGALLAVIGLWALSRLVRGRWAIAVALFWLAWAAGGRFPNRWRMLSELATGELTFEQGYEEGRYENGGHSLHQNRAAAAWLAEHTEPEEKVFVWGYDPMIYVLADRRPVSRFPYHYAQIVPWAPERYRTELFEALRADPPAVIVVGTKDSVRVVTRTRLDSAQLMEGWDELADFVHEGYRQTEMVGRFQMWERRE